MAKLWPGLPRRRAWPRVRAPALGDRRAAIGDHDGFAGGEPLEAGHGSARGRPSLRLRAREHEVDRRGLLLLAVVEEGEPAIAVAEKAQHGRRAVDRAV